MNGSVQKILQKGLPKANMSRTRRAATASGRRRKNTPQQAPNLSAQVRNSMYNKKNTKKKSKAGAKRKKKAKSGKRQRGLSHLPLKRQAHTP